MSEMKYPEKMITALQGFPWNMTRENAINEILRSGSHAIAKRLNMDIPEFREDFEMSKGYKKAIDIKRGEKDVS
ncbi:MAG: hypothetical protein GY797_27120 [Deltaproteobacteria bacterium]|nr:hypothetical protein [Deltaproteobacteria bacterium]